MKYKTGYAASPGAIAESFPSPIDEEYADEPVLDDRPSRTRVKKRRGQAPQFAPKNPFGQPRKEDPDATFRSPLLDPKNLPLKLTGR